MASINIDPPVSTPSHEWAANTTDALHTTSASAGAHIPTTTSQPSTPGVEFPGAFPREARSTPTPQRTPHAAATHLADAAPPKSTSDLQDTAISYLPNVGVQRAFDTAKQYLPESVVGAVGSVLPASMTTNGSHQPSQTEKNLDPTSGAKLTSVDSPGSASTSVDNASTRAIAPSSPSRAGSLASHMTEGVNTPSAGPNAGLGTALDDGTSQAKPNTTLGAPSPQSQSATSPMNSASAAVAMHSLPTPPASKDTSPVNSLSTQNDSEKKSAGSNPPGLRSDTERDYDDTPMADSGSKYKDNQTSTSASQPQANTTPSQPHVKRGTAVGAHAPGTGPAGGSGDYHPPPSSSSTYPQSELSTSRFLEDGGGEKNLDKAKDDEHSGRRASGEDSHENLVGDEDGNDRDGNEKKEGRVKKAVHKMKDKLSHRSH